MSTKPSIFLSHNVADKAFVRLLAIHLRQAGAEVWLDDEEIRVGDSLIGRIESGLINSDYLGVVLSPNSVSSYWVQTELRAVLTREIASGGKVCILPIYYRECEIPLFLRDKRYADFRKGSYRKALLQLLQAMGLTYEPIRRLKAEVARNPLSIAAERILSTPDGATRRNYATALQVSLSGPYIVERPQVAVPDFIAETYRIPLRAQMGIRISLVRSDAYKYLRNMGRVLKSFMNRGLEARYRQRFNREPSRGPSGPDHFLFSYGELFEWFDIPEVIEMPPEIASLVDWQHVPTMSDVWPPDVSM